MELTLEQARQRLSSPNNLANKLEKFRNQRKISLEDDILFVSAGRQLPRLPSVAAEEIKEAALAGEMTQKEIAAKYGITQPAVSYHKREAEKAEEAQKTPEQKIKEARAKDVAIDKMMLAMGLISEEKLSKLNAAAMASAVKNLSSAYRDISGPEEQQKAQVNLIVYSPEVRSEESYKIIEISPERS